MGILKKKIVASGHGKITPKYLVVHSTANPGATAANHLTYWGSGNAKYYAHAVSDWTQAVQAVEWDRKCYHVGGANGFTIGIEICEGKTEDQRDKGIEIAAQACAEILKSKGWSVSSNLITHDDCRRRWGGTDHTDPLPYFKKCGISWSQFKAKVEGYMTGKVQPSKPSTPATSSNSGKLAIDGRVGPATVKAWQKIMGTSVDGVISHQTEATKKYHYAINAVQYDNTRKGSLLIKAVQKKLGAVSDGLLGPNTIKAIQKRLDVTADGHFGPNTAKALQTRLNSGKF